MGILNYTTTVPAVRSATEIGHRLAKHGASQVTTRYATNPNGATQPVAVSFSIATEYGPRNFDLPANVDGVYRALRRDRSVPPRYTNPEQAERVAWRILKDWVEAQLALIQAGLARLDEVLLPYMVTHTGRTLAVEYRESAGLRQAIEAAPGRTDNQPIEGVTTS